MSFSLGRRAQQWNAIAQADRTAAARLRRAHVQRLCCHLMAHLDQSELRVLLAVQARTLRFNKLAEAISLTQFCSGLRDSDGDLVLDGEDLPYFEGCNIAKTETVSLALRRLEARGLITRWRLGQRSNPVYMPFSEDWLAAEMVRAEGAIARDYERILENEHYLLPHRGVFQVIDTSDERGVILEPRSARLGWREGECIGVRPEHWAASGLRRLTVEEILAARRHR
jgi:hypothetical protein